jgi:hypothetical protein
MLDRRLWTDEEMDMLRVLYISGRGFDEIDTAFPERSANAIRQKASRLGVKRPVVSHSLCESKSVLRCSDGNGGDDAFLFKCGDCGNWIHVDSPDQHENQAVVCPQCKAVSRYVA